MANPLTQYHERSKTHKEEFPEMVLKQIDLQKEMFKIYEFDESVPRKICDWIEKFCIITEGELSGQKLKMLLWEKWLVYSIFGFYGEIETEVFDENGDLIGLEKKRQRIVNEVLIVVASGNAKTTLVGKIITALMHLPILNNPNIFIGSTAMKQSRICYEAVRDIIRANPALDRSNKITDSFSKITNQRTGAELKAMSSERKGQEGIIPALIVLDELHVMSTSAYAEALKKSAKRDDMLVIETSTHGMDRGGYLDKRLDSARNLLNGDTKKKDYRKLSIIYEQDSEQEIILAHENKEYGVIKKSNPSLGHAVKIALIKGKIDTLINDPTQRGSILTYNFNIPQNPKSSFFTMAECKAKPFDERIFYNAPVFLGFDMAWTRTPESDLPALRILTVNPLTGDRYAKDICFLPKWCEVKTVDDNGNIIISREEMIPLKSKIDANIPYNKKDKRYGYAELAEKGEVVTVDEELIEKLVELYGENARFDCTGICEEFIIYYIAYLEQIYNFTICKFGLDPNKANQIETYFNGNVSSVDGKPPVIKFQMEKTTISNPILERLKDIRARGLMHCNSKLTELHCATAVKKETVNGFKLVNPSKSRKDIVIAEACAESAYNVFTTNRDTGISNMELLKEWWAENGGVEK